MRTLLCLTVLTLACGRATPPPVFTLTPNAGSSFGQQRVVARGDFASLADPLSVTVGGIAAFDVVRDGDTVSFTTQGSPTPGPSEVVITGQTGELRGPTFNYAPPVDAHFQRMVAFGASLTMGAQDASVSIRSQTHGPTAQLARAAGAYLSLPLVKDGFMPAITADDFDKQTCAFTAGSNVFQVVGTRVGPTLLQHITDHSGVPHLDWARVDPQLEARNVAIAGMRIGQDVSGANDLVNTVLEHLIWDPFVDLSALLAEPKQTMLDRVVALQPTIVVTTDLFGNDYDNVDLSRSGVPDLSALTPLDEFQSQLDTVLARLDSTGAELFIANGPDATLLPAYSQKVQALRDAGFSEADATGWVTAIQARIDAYNAALTQAAASHPRVHLVDLHGEIASIFANGLDVGGQHLTAKPFGGLLSLDGMHFSDTGYATLAQTYVAAINGALGTRIPDIDLAAVLADDPYSVANLRAQGFACAGD